MCTSVCLQCEPVCVFSVEQSLPAYPSCAPRCSHGNHSQAPGPVMVGRPDGCGRNRRQVQGTKAVHGAGQWAGGKRCPSQGWAPLGSVGGSVSTQVELGRPPPSGCVWLAIELGFSAVMASALKAISPEQGLGSGGVSARGAQSRGIRRSVCKTPQLEPCFSSGGWAQDPLAWSHVPSKSVTLPPIPV